MAEEEIMIEDDAIALEDSVQMFNLVNLKNLAYL